MKEIIKEVKKTEVIAYEANDGTRFSKREECEEYEQTAYAVIKARFLRMKVGDDFSGETLADGTWLQGYYGDRFALIDIKDEDDVKAANMYWNEVGKNNRNNRCFEESMVGKRILVNIYTDYDGDVCYIVGDYEEYTSKYRNNMKRLFYPEQFENKEKEGE